MNMPSRHSSRSRRSRSRRLKPELIMAGVCLLIVAAGAGYFLQSLWGAVPDVSGVWKGLSDSRTYVIEREGDNYLLEAGGHRLPVQGVGADRREGLLQMTVRTDSGLLANWTFQGMDAIQGAPAIHLDQDGLLSETLILQHPLRPDDRRRLQQEAPLAQAGWSPSFDCAKAASQTQRILCTDPSLAVADNVIAGLMKHADAAEKADEETWENEVRDTCPDLGCMHTAYRDRLRALNMANDAKEVAKVEKEYDMTKPMPEPVDAAPGATPAASAPPAMDELSAGQDDPDDN